MQDVRYERREKAFCRNVDDNRYMLIKSRGIVLHTLKYNDAGCIVDILTREEGFQSFFVRISRGKRGGLKSAFFQPLTAVDIEWNHKSTSNLQTLRSVSPHPMTGLECPEKITLALFLAEFLRTALRSEPIAAPLFDYTWDSIEWLNLSEQHFSNFHLVFLLRMTHFLGFYPNLENYADGMFFDLENSSFVAHQPLHSHYLDPTDAAFLPTFMRMQPATMHLFKFSGARRTRLLRFIVSYYQLHLPAFGELKSLNVLEAVFQD